MSYAFNPEDVYWGQLSGCLEAIYAGTTTVLDHAHCVYSPDHGVSRSKSLWVFGCTLTDCAAAISALDATLDSGVRAIFGYTVATRMSQWDQSQCLPEQDIMPAWALRQLGDLIEKHNTSASLVEVGMGFDLWFLPKDMVLGVFETLRQKGLRLVTSHVGRNAFMGELSRGA